MSDTIQIPMISLMFHQNALSLWLDHDRDDFWVNLGEFAGWGRFRNRDRVYPPSEGEIIIFGPCSAERCQAQEAANHSTPPVKEHLFLLVEVIPAGSPPPSPIACGSNVLWRKQEALESIARQTAYLRGLDDSL